MNCWWKKIPKGPWNLTWNSDLKRMTKKNTIFGGGTIFHIFLKTNSVTTTPKISKKNIKRSFFRWWKNTSSRLKPPPSPPSSIFHWVMWCDLTHPTSWSTSRHRPPSLSIFPARSEFRKSCKAKRVALWMTPETPSAWIFRRKLRSGEVFLLEKWIGEKMQGGKL